MLDKLSDAKIQNSTRRNLELEYVREIKAHKRLEKNYSINENPGFHSHDDKLEYSLCPMRYVYSCVLGECPAYVSEYQQNRAIVRLIQILHKLLKDRFSMEEIAEQVFALFPYIRKAEKRQMVDDAMRWTLPGKEESYTVLDNHQYTDERMNLAFLDQGTYTYAKKMAAMLMRQGGRTGIYPERKGMDGSKNCEFCPHARYCSYGFNRKSM